MRKVIRQHDLKDCGAACLSSVALFYGLKMPLSSFRELTNTSLQGTSIENLINAANTIELKGEGLFGSTEALLDAKIKVPFIAHVIIDNEISHYIVIFKLTHNYALIGDPARGIVKIKFSEFSKIWTGYALKLEPTENFKKGNLCDKNTKILKFLLEGQFRKILLLFLLSIIFAIIGVISAFVLECLTDNLLSSEKIGTIEIFHIHESTNKITTLLYEINRFVDYQKPASLILYLMIFLLVFVIIQTILACLRGYLISKMAKEMDYKIGTKYCTDVIDMKIKDIISRQTGDYLSRLSDTVTIRQAVSLATLTLLLDSIMVFSCAVILSILNLKL